MNKAIKTKNQISQALIELLNNKPLDLITIKELAKITLCRFFVFFITKNGQRSMIYLPPDLRPTLVYNQHFFIYILAHILL